MTPPHPGPRRLSPAPAGAAEAGIGGAAIGYDGTWSPGAPPGRPGPAAGAEEERAKL